MVGMAAAGAVTLVEEVVADVDLAVEVAAVASDAQGSWAQELFEQFQGKFYSI